MSRQRTCDQEGCQWTYTQPVRLRAHLATVHGVGDLRHCCAQCDKSYARADDLRRHVKACHEQASMSGFTCPNCMKVFKEERTMKTHLSKVCRMGSMADDTVHMLAYRPPHSHCTPAFPENTARQSYGNSSAFYGDVVDLDGSIPVQHEDEDAEHDIISPQARRLTGSMALDAGRTSRQLVHRSRNRQVRQDSRKALRHRLASHDVIGSPCYTVNLDGSSVEDDCFVVQGLFWTVAFFSDLEGSQLVIAPLLLGSCMDFVVEHYGRLLGHCRKLLSVFNIADPGNITVLRKLRRAHLDSLDLIAEALQYCASFVGDNNGAGPHGGFANALDEAKKLQRKQGPVNAGHEDAWTRNVSKCLPTRVDSMVKDILGHCDNSIELEIESSRYIRYMWCIDDDGDVILQSSPLSVVIADLQGISESGYDDDDDEDDYSEGTERSEAGDCLWEEREDVQDATEDADQCSTGLIDVDGGGGESQSVELHSTPILCSTTALRTSDDVEMMMEIEQDGAVGVIGPFQPAYDALACFEASEFYSPFTNLSPLEAI